jgi:uncharacterized membrane protein YdjX (TVP38/TMEM64 family)
MSSDEPPVRRKLPLIKLSILALALIAGALVAMRGVNYRALAEQGMAVIRGAGPWAFFAGIVVLPAVGAPLTAFTVTAGEAFAPQMTMAGVVAAVLVSIAADQALTYWLARYALRPVLSRLAERYGYKVPRVTGANALSVALLVRLTPGPPFFMQSYILGLAEVPFRLYMVVSWLAIVPWAVGGVVLGKGVFDGHYKMAGAGAAVIAAAAALVHWLRKRYATRVV